MISHKYLNEIIEPEYHNNLWPFNQEGYPDCEEFGFDTRETFEFDTFMIMWLYERLRYFQEEASKVVDFNYHKFIIHGEELTQSECIERMCKLCAKYVYEVPIDFNENTGEIYNMDEINACSSKKPNIARELFYILGEVFPEMWW